MVPEYGCIYFMTLKYVCYKIKHLIWKLISSECYFQSQAFLGLPDPEVEDTVILSNVDKHLTINKAWHPKWFQTAAALQWKPQNKTKKKKKTYCVIQ